MKTFHTSLILLLGALPCLSIAQETQRVETAETSGLQINSRTDKERIQFLSNVAQVYFSEEDYVSAMNAYERILEIDPENPEALYIIAHVYINAKQYAKAETLLKKLIEENPDDFKLKNNLAWLYATAEDPRFRDGEKAVRYAQEAMVIEPTDHHIWSTLSEAHYINGEYEKAYRAIKNMALLASQYGTGITKESVENYNEQIRKCKRAWDTQKMLEGEEEE
ncbi:tetratricopeptide repeat protein [Pontiellaceae bacterium B12219]|nr:tetratricopeptide repeat protein [Pontiellaceae bacterium B12219]